MTLCQKCKHAKRIWENAHGDRVECVSPARMKKQLYDRGLFVQAVIHNQRDECEFFEERDAVSI